MTFVPGDLVNLRYGKMFYENVWSDDDNTHGDESFVVGEIRSYDLCLVLSGTSASGMLLVLSSAGLGYVAAKNMKPAFE